MLGVERFYNRELLDDSIRFNTHFLEFSCSESVEDYTALNHYSQVKMLLIEWDRRKYKTTPTTEWAHLVLDEFEKGHILHQ